MGNQEAKSAEQTQGAATASSGRSAVAMCCLNSAMMLRVADQGEISTKEKRGAILACNEGQAKLLIAAAECADNLIAELRQCATELEEAAKLLRPHYAGMATIYEQATIRVLSAIRSSMA